jgi:hypothetical protein
LGKEDRAACVNKIEIIIHRQRDKLETGRATSDPHWALGSEDRAACGNKIETTFHRPTQRDEPETTSDPRWAAIRRQPAWLKENSWNVKLLKKNHTHNKTNKTTSAMSLRSVQEK